MKKKTIIVCICLLAVAIAVCSILYSYRERSLAQVLPELPDQNVLVYFPQSDMDTSLHLSEEQTTQLLDAMNQAKYRRMGKIMGLDSYASVMYVTNGRQFEILFSDQDGGSILINDVDSDGWKPLYRVLPSGDALKNLLNQFMEAAQKPESTP